jgi:hypothetical protein
VQIGITTGAGFVARTAPGFQERLVPLVEEDLTIRM